MHGFMHDLVIDIGHLENGSAELHRSKFIQMLIERRILFVNYGSWDEVLEDLQCGQCLDFYS